MDDSRVENQALAAAGGDTEAFRRLYDHFSPSLFGYLADLTDPALAEDLLHELWLKAMGKNGQRRGPMRPWLFAVARNLAIDVMRATRTNVSLEACVEVAGVSDDGTSELEEQSCRLRSAVQQLPSLHRDVVLLRHYSGLPLQSIADILGVPVGTVASRLRSALSKLQKEVFCDAQKRT